MSQQYSLRWNNHQPNFISMFTTLLNTQTLVDVTLAAEGKHLKAHKVVLSACSTYFQSLFVDNPSHHPIVILKDVKFADLRTMVDFMYYGQVNVTEEQLPQVLDTAKTLKIKGLTEMPESLARSQTAEFHPNSNHTEQRQSASPASPTIKRKRRRKSSTCSTALSVVQEDVQVEESPAAMEFVRDGGITLSSVPRQQQIEQNINFENVNHLQNNPPVLTSGGQWVVDPCQRYNTACLGVGTSTGVIQDNGYMNNVIHHTHNMEVVNEYAQGLGMQGPSPGPSGAPIAPLEQDSAPPSKRRRTTNPQSGENFQRALQAVRFGGIGFCKAAKMFGVNNRTLWLEFQKRGYTNNRPSIRNRIKRECTTPTGREPKQEMQPMTQQMTLVSPTPPPPQPVPMSYIESQTVEFQNVTHSTPLNILNVNFNTMQ